MEWDEVAIWGSTIWERVLRTVSESVREQESGWSLEQEADTVKED